MMAQRDLESVAQQLWELDTKIVEVAQTAGELMQRGATMGRVEDEIAFLSALLRRRGTVLSEYRRAGGTLKDPYKLTERAGG